MHDASRALAQALRYRGAGTVEFLVDTESATVVFLEVNARIQVEHPVTEEAYGVDLVAAQLRLALGEDPELPDVPPVPHATAIELRINAEDPQNDFGLAPARSLGFGGQPDPASAWTPSSRAVTSFHRSTTA